MCMNNHKFCHPCLFVWATSGPSENHGRCPVCRSQGYYVKCREIGEKIDRKIVKCHVQSCKWTGALKNIGTHQHTTYTKTGLPYRPTNIETSTVTRQDDLPPLQNGQRTPLIDRTNRQSIIPPERSSYRLASRNDDSSVPRTARHSVTNVSSPSVVTNVSSSNNVPSSSEVPHDPQTPRTPRPPSVARPVGTNPRRRPTLPSIVGQLPNSSARSVNNNTTSVTNTSATTSNTNSSSNTNTESRPRGHLLARRARVNQREPPINRESTQLSQLTQTETSTAGGETDAEFSVRDRLRDSRVRLDALMTTFSSELDRGRRELSEFQEQRELRRQEQLTEVRDLGRRLGGVATELRRLLEQRRQLRDALPDTSDHL